MAVDIERTDEYTNFIRQLNDFHVAKGTTLQAEPILGGKRLDLYRLFKFVVAAGGFDEVTRNRHWKHIGENFNFPPTCTNSAYILKGVYIRNLLGWEEEKIWGNPWTPPAELRGPNAHKASNLAGKTYKKNAPKRKQPSTKNASKSNHYIPIKPVVSQPIDSLLPAQVFEQTALINEPHTCTVAEMHHQSQPLDHVHPPDGASKDCLIARSFDHTTKEKVLYGLQSANNPAMEWALDYVVTISFESPEELRLDNTPALLELLLEWAQPFLDEHGAGVDNMMSHASKNRIQSPAFAHILKVLHILRNFSFLEINARMLAAHVRLKALLIKSLLLSSSSDFFDLGRHCIDVLENIAPVVELKNPFDDYIACLANLVYTQDRYLLIGAIRVLTMLATQENNQLYLLSGLSQIPGRLTALLVANDEELIGTVLEYLYQFSKISPDFRFQLLSAHSGANIGLLVSLMTARSKYFCPRVVRERASSGGSPLSVGTPTASHSHDTVPCVPNLSNYQQLDEPYRCLGWLKDKFEVADSSCILLLDDIYLLYEMRFGQEKALKMKDFYVVLKIAFPGVLPSAEGNTATSTAGPVLEGIAVRGIQVKMSILQDGQEVICGWTNCSRGFSDASMLEQHIVRDHVEGPSAAENSECMWTDCFASGREFKDKGEMTMHMLTHFGECLETVAHGHHDHQPADLSDVRGVALVAAHLLRQLSKDPASHQFFKPYESELARVARRRPKLADFVQNMFSHFTA